MAGLTKPLQLTAAASRLFEVQGLTGGTLSAVQSGQIEFTGQPSSLVNVALNEIAFSSGADVTLTGTPKEANSTDPAGHAYVNGGFQIDGATLALNGNVDNNSQITLGSGARLVIDATMSPEIDAAAFSGFTNNPGADISAASGATVEIRGKVTNNGQFTAQAITFLPGTTFIQNGAFQVGSALQVGAGVTFVANEAVVAPSVELNGGTLRTGTFANLSGGTFNWTSGTLHLTASDLSIGAGGPLGATVELINGQTLNVNQAVVIASDGRLQLSGGGFTAGQLVNDGVLTFGGNNSSITFDQPIIGTRTVLSGTNGVTTLSAVSTYTGATQVVAGTLRLTDAADLTGTSGVILAAPGTTLELQNEGEFSASVSGAGRLLKSGSSTTELLAANTHVGGTTIAGGVLAVSDDAQLGAVGNTLAMNNGGTLRVLGTSFGSTPRNISLSNGALDIADAGHTFTLNQTLANASQLKKLGAGTLARTTTLDLGVGTGGVLEVADGVFDIDGPLFLNGNNGAPGLDGGQLLVSGGMLDPSSNVSLTGGNGAAASIPGFDGWTGGPGGTVSVTAGVLNTGTVVNLTGGSGGGGSTGTTGGRGGNGGQGSIGGSIAVSGGLVVVNGSLLFRGGAGGAGGNGGNAIFGVGGAGGNGGIGGSGGSIIVSGGEFQFLAGAINQAGGIGGNRGLGGSGTLGSGPNGNPGVSGSPGTLVLVGGTLTTTAARLDVSHTGNFVFSSGTLHLTEASFAIGQGGKVASVLGGNFASLAAGQTLQIDNTLVIPAGRTLTMAGGTLKAGTIDAEGGAFNLSSGRLSPSTFDGDLVNTGGTLAPGNSPGATSITGNYTQGASATLEIEIAGTTPFTQFDQVNIAGDASLAGTLDLDLLGGFVPAASDSFTFMTYAARTGTFDTVALPTLPAGLDWSLDYGATALTIAVTSTMFPGDIDLDGDVDRSDAALFAPHLGTADGAVWTTGDFDSDGATTLADLALLQANLGQPLPAPAATLVSVPEPASITLLLVGLIATAAFRRFHKVRG